MTSTTQKCAIITRTPAKGHDDWKAELRRALRSPMQLLEHGGHASEHAAPAQAGHEQFPVRVPARWAGQMTAGDLADPLLRQVLPLAAEAEVVPGFVADAVGDLSAMSQPGVIHKYQGRVLLVATGACAIHCRYCFRRHFPYGQATAAAGDWKEALAYIAGCDDVNEVILSGGDPLMLDTGKLQRLGSGLSELPHIRRLRIHSRMPVVLPSRIDPALCDWLSGLSLQKVVVTHVNHPAELFPAAREALARLREKGVTLLNQSVLLAGVNDRADVLASLSEALFAAGVLPYYLHLLDPVAGAAHFDVDESRASSLMEQLRRQLSGFLVPRLVREKAGAPYKLPVA